MLEIRETELRDGYEEIVARAGKDDLRITEAFCGDRVTGFIAYRCGNDKTVIYDYDDGGDLQLCDGLVRSVLLKSCLRSIDTAVFSFSDESKYSQLVKLGFVQNDCKTMENLTEFMNSCEKCGENL